MVEKSQWSAFAGIDWGGEHHQLCVVDGAGNRLVERRVTHDVAGLVELETLLQRFATRMPIAVERSEGLLVEQLQANGHVVFAVSPRIAARARERYKVAAVKDDRFDAFVLADSLRHEHTHWRSMTTPSPLLAEIKALTRDRDRLLETQQAVEHQLRMILEAYHPAPVRLFSSVDRQITLSFILDYPTPAIASRVKTTRMAGFLARHHYTGRVSAQVLADRMRANLLTASAGTVAGKSFSAQSYTRLLQLLNSQLADYDDAIAAAVAEHPDAPIFASFPGVGPVTTGVLLSEIGEDRDRYPHAQALLAEAGLAPVTRASGRSRSVRFRYAANTRLRESAMWWAFNSMKESPWAAAAFREARTQRGQRYHRALRGLSARWMRVLWRCWTDGTPYDPAKHTTAVPATA
ncbi:IS110 family RNA-guided transposase [Mycolicibacter senuensis]|uniref:IS110 family transposase n=1 Tax=Mycolicibacter senuensis TaxID=386913 RepID=A0A7I9XN16_9MYCO|nr:IS110 family transposase [Mycolicibacter senuensis]ORW69447.1 transposase [Mycolicibacter senuensis]GFG70940.1 IS110 family transposase [Mycolicibacter senuensis]